MMSLSILAMIMSSASAAPLPAQFSGCQFEYHDGREYLQACVSGAVTTFAKINFGPLVSLDVDIPFIDEPCRDFGVGGGAHVWYVTALAERAREHGDCTAEASANILGYLQAEAHATTVSLRGSLRGFVNALASCDVPDGVPPCAQQASAQASVIGCYTVFAEFRVPDECEGPVGVGGAVNFAGELCGFPGEQLTLEVDLDSSPPYHVELDVVADGSPLNAVVVAELVPGQTYKLTAKICKNRYVAVGAGTNCPLGVDGCNWSAAEFAVNLFIDDED